MTDWHRDVYKKADDMEFPENWDDLRQETIRRYKHRCYRCDKKMKPLTAHHMIPREEGGNDDLSNLVALCTECHDFVEVHFLRTRSAIIGSYDEPMIEQEEKKMGAPREETFTRPDWHKYVYGGEKKP